MSLLYLLRMTFSEVDIVYNVVDNLNLDIFVVDHKFWKCYPQKISWKEDFIKYNYTFYVISIDDDVI